ncbi:MAG: hypothetical protein K2L12_00345, partial [Clostridia bacterium]|nr:hypothetical protein [Clostridia bacterium]
MKTTKKFFLTAAAMLAAVCCAFGFAACEHEHAYRESWSADETSHWHACIVKDCTQKDSLDEHTFGEWEVFIPATEQSGGQEKRTCTVCEYAELRNTDKLTQKTCDHDWSDWTVTDANKPTASAVGKATRTCANDGCDAKPADKEYALPALSSEEYTKGTDSATCTSGGTVEYSYDKDGVKVTFQVETSAKSHSLTHVDAESAACTENGTLEHWECSVCHKKFSDANGATQVADANLVAPAAHSWGDWADKTPATCTAAKVEERVCAKNPGHTETRFVGEPLGHSWNNGEITTPAACTEEGVKTFTCTVNGCGETKTEPVAANGHSW